MKFKVASKALYSTLSGVSKVINSRNTLSILDNFHWKVDDGNLIITASDSENTLTAKVAITNVSGEGDFCVNARRISDIAKELPDVDVEFDINESNYAMKISFPGGKAPNTRRQSKLPNLTRHSKCNALHRRFSAALKTPCLL